MADTGQFCTFYLDGHFFGIPVAEVQEVLGYQEIRGVPLVPDTVCGLINLRGQIVTAIDLRRCLGMPERAAEQHPMIIVRAEDGAVSLLVDEIGDVLAIDSTGFELPPQTLDGPARAVVRGVYKLRERLLLELDIARAIATANTAHEFPLPRQEEELAQGLATHFRPSAPRCATEDGEQSL